MKSVPLSVFPRAAVKRPAVKKLRSSERIPAVIYGRERQPQNLEVQLRALQDLIHHSGSENILVDLTVTGDARPSRLALVQEVQHHALSGKFLHVDFHEVAENEKVTIMVPDNTRGEAAGVKTGGGVLEHVLHRLKVRALPKDLPEALVVDVTALEIGHAIHIGEIPAPAGVEILGDKHISVIAVSAPIAEVVEVAPEAAAGATPGEPEVLTEKKEEGEGAAKAGAAKAGADKAAPKAGEKAAEKKK